MRQERPLFCLYKENIPMWFEHLTPEEIRKRLRTEGVFSPMLEGSSLTDEDGNEHREKQLDVKECNEVLKEAAKDILLPKFSGIPKPEIVEQKSYTRISTKKGDAVLELLADAEESIFITHLTPEIYTEKYVALLLEKVLAGLIVERIVCYHPAHYPEAYEWLDRFFDENGTIGRYKQFQIEGTPLLPCDVMIVDRKYVVLWLHEEALFFESRKMAARFLTMWERLTPREENGKNKMELVVSRQCEPY
jgi:hypothetical protein